MKLPYTTVRDTIRRYRETGNYNYEYREFLRKKVGTKKRTVGVMGSGCFNKTALHHTEQKKLEIWSETSPLNASKSTSARSETMENGHRIRPIYVWRTSHYGAFWKTKHVQSPISRSKRWRKVWLRHGTLYLKKSLIELWTTSRSVWRSALMPKVAILKINS